MKDEPILLTPFQLYQLHSKFAQQIKNSLNIMDYQRTQLDNSKHEEKGMSIKWERTFKKPRFRIEWYNSIHSILLKPLNIEAEMFLTNNNGGILIKILLQL